MNVAALDSRRSNSAVAAGWGALVAVALDLAGVFVDGGRFIALDSAASSIQRDYIALGRRPALHALIITVVMALLLWFASALRKQLEVVEPEGSPWSDVFFGAVLLIAGAELVRATALATLGLRSADLDASVVSTLHVISHLIGPVTALPAAAATAAIWRISTLGRFPRWVRRLAPLVAAAWLVSAVRIVTTDETVWRLAIPAFATYALLVVGLAISMIRRTLVAEDVRRRS
jgi:hypothetical protein